MSVVSLSQLSFTGGEWAPSLYARNDLAKIATAVRKMRNAYPHPHGGASNRGGTVFVHEVKDSTKKTRLIRFQFSVVQSYVLEFGDQYMRVYKDGGIVVTGPSTPYELTTPYLEADLALLKFTQSADVLYVTHPSYAARKISRTDHTAWSISLIGFAASISAPTGFQGVGGSGTSYQFVVTAVNALGEESVASIPWSAYDNSSFSWNAVSGAESYNIYKELHSGSTVYGWCAQSSTTSLSGGGNMAADMDITPPKAFDPIASANNYPGVATFFEQRLVFARSNNEPQSFWGSVVGSFESMNRSSPIKDDDAYKFTLNARQVNEIRAMVPLDVLLIFTSGGEWKVSAGSNSDAITPSSVDVKVTSRWGISNVPPLVIGNTVLFIEESGSVVRDLTYSLEIDGYAGNDLGVFAHHLLEEYVITEWAYQQHPDSIVWAIRSDGVLVGMTYYREHQVWGWHQHDTDGTFESITSVTNSEGVDDVYVIVKRNINGVEKKYVEILAPRLPVDENYNHNIEDAYFVDCGLSYNAWNAVAADLMKVSGGTTWGVGETLTLTAIGGHTPFVVGDIGKTFRLRLKYKNAEEFWVTDSVDLKVVGYTSSTEIDVTPTNRAVPSSLRDVNLKDWAKLVTSISGLDHLEAKTVSILADGNVVSNLVVTGGAITLPNLSAKIHVGLQYISDIETMDFEAAVENGSTQDKQRNTVSVLARLKDTRAFFIGPDVNHLDEVAFREDEDYGDPTALFTGDKEIPIEPGDGRQTRVFIRNVDPLPMTILALTPRVEYGEV